MHMLPACQTHASDCHQRRAAAGGLWEVRLTGVSAACVGGAGLEALRPGRAEVLAAVHSIDAITT